MRIYVWIYFAWIIMVQIWHEKSWFKNLEFSLWGPLMMLSDWFMSCQAWPPHARYGQSARCKHWRQVVYFLHKMACFNSVYLKYCQTFQWNFNTTSKQVSSLLVQKFRGDMMRSCSVVAKSKHACLQRTNKESASPKDCNSPNTVLVKITGGIFLHDLMWFITHSAQI